MHFVQRKTSRACEQAVQCKLIYAFSLQPCRATVPATLPDTLCHCSHVACMAVESKVAVAGVLCADYALVSGCASGRLLMVVALYS